MDYQQLGNNGYASNPNKNIMIGLVILIVLVLLIWWGVSAGKKLVAETPDERRQIILDASQVYFADYCLQSENLPIQDPNADYVKSVSIKDADKVNDYIKKGGTVPDSDDIFECASGLCNVDAQFMGADYTKGCPLDMYCQPSDIASDNTLTYSLLNQSDNSSFTKCPDPRTDINNPKGKPSGSGGDKPGGAVKYITDIFVTAASKCTGRTNGVKYTQGTTAPDGKTKLCYTTTDKSTQGIDQFTFAAAGKNCDSDWKEVLDIDGKSYDWKKYNGDQKLCYKTSNQFTPYSTIGFAYDLVYDNGHTGKFPHYKMNHSTKQKMLRWNCGKSRKIVADKTGELTVLGTSMYTEAGKSRDRGLRLCAEGGTNVKRDSMPNSTPASRWDAKNSDGKYQGFYNGETLRVSMGIESEVAGSRNLNANISSKAPTKKQDGSSSTGFNKKHEKKLCSSPYNTVDFKADGKEIWVWHDNYGDDNAHVDYNSFFDSKSGKRRAIAFWAHLLLQDLIIQMQCYMKVPNGYRCTIIKHHNTTLHSYSINKHRIKM